MSVEILTAITALIVALTGPAIVPKIIDAYRAGKSGRARAEKQRNRESYNQLETEMAFRRRMEEYASFLRRMLIDAGIPEDRIPPWPVKRSRT